jgi:hypothetical protein
LEDVPASTDAARLAAQRIASAAALRQAERNRDQLMCAAAGWGIRVVLIWSS